MKCPRCYTDMKAEDRQGVEIDYCPECRGVWLDRGELQKIVSFTSSSVLELARTMAENILSREGEPGHVTIAFARRAAGEDEIRELG